ncbi:hypothetical protein GXW82_31675 [Streptacidiphilus sp. 4-A2]|nr:hypothetical protein [Streptacidiphilus sp. 4-A2]
MTEVRDAQGEDGGGAAGGVQFALAQCLPQECSGVVPALRGVGQCGLQAVGLRVGCDALCLLVG